MKSRSCVLQYLRVKALAFSALLLTLGLGAERVHAATISVDKIVVVQSVQNNSNSVPLVTSRSTAVRATLKVTGSLANITSVTGKINVFVNGTLKTPGGIAALNQPFTAKLFPSDNNQNDTLNFEIPSSTITSPLFGTTATVRFEIDLTRVGHTTVDYTSPNFTFNKRAVPRIFYTRINYTPAGLGLPSLATVQAGRGDSMVKGLYPVADNNPYLYQQGLFPTLPFSYDPNGDHIMQDYEGSELLDDLEACRQLIVDGGYGADDRTFLYGWLAGNPTDHNGQAVINGRVGYGNTEATRFQRTFAHELGHQFGFVHTSSNIDQLGWDVTSRLPNNPAGNNTTGRLKPLTLWDIMVPAKLTKDAWIRSDRYTTLFNHETLQPDFFFPFVLKAVTIQGYVDPAGPVEIRTVFRYPWRSAQTSRPLEQGRFIARAAFADGSVRNTRFDVNLGDSEGEGRPSPDFGPFSLTLPYSEQIQSLDILDAATGKQLTRITRSELLPAVQVISPKRGEKLGNQGVIEFAYADRDADPTNLRFNIAYSWDGGKSFVPLAVNIRGLKEGRNIKVPFDVSALPPSFGNGLIKVLSSDGLNTSDDDVPDLTTPAWVTGHIALEDCMFPTDQPVKVNIKYNDNDGDPTNDYATRDVTLAADGSYTVMGIRPVDCTMQIKSAKWLAKTVHAVVNGPTVAAPDVTLLGGDANNDNSIDVLDLDLLIASFDSSEGDLNWNAGPDFNCDTVVDVLDLDILIRNFDAVGDDLP